MTHFQSTNLLQSNASLVLRSSRAAAQVYCCAGKIKTSALPGIWHCLHWISTYSEVWLQLHLQVCNYCSSWKSFFKAQAAVLLLDSHQQILSSGKSSPSGLSVHITVCSGYEISNLAQRTNKQLLCSSPSEVTVATQWRCPKMFLIMTLS